MKILWFTWKDRDNPLAGGAEVVNEELAKRLAQDGHEVRFIVGGFPGGSSEATRNGFKITRVGGRVSVYWQAYRFYKAHLQGWADQVIDEINTIPFFASFYCKEPVKIFIHQLARQIWFYEMWFPANLIGYLAEPIYLWLLRETPVITVSESTKKDLVKYGFDAQHIHIISEGIELEPIGDLKLVVKDEKPTILALGSIRSMKRTADIVKAFEIARDKVPDLQLVVAGVAEGEYGKGVLQSMEISRYKEDISYLGKISQEKKIELLRRAHLLCVASVKEGWGLVVTEANSQGTPAIVYDVDGLRDSVRGGRTGVICDQDANSMAGSIVMLMRDRNFYERLCEGGWTWSGELTFEKAYADFSAQII